MKVHFIGAGPGAADLITLRGLKLIQTCSVCLYAGSLVSEEVIKQCPAYARIINTAQLTLEEIIGHMKLAHQNNLDVARLHSGDPSLYGAIEEQMRALDKLNIAYDITPGVPAFAAAAAVMKKELTIPHINQSIILSRTAVNSSAMPSGETLANLSASGATLALHLSIQNIKSVTDELIPFYGKNCPVVVAARISWPDEQLIYATLETIEDKLKQTDIKRSAIIFVGKALSYKGDERSQLYFKD